MSDELDRLIEAADEISREYWRFETAAAYMQQLLDLIDQHPMLRDEWEVFLQRADLPPFKETHERES